MDELKLNFTTKIMNGILSKIIMMAIRKKIGSNVDITMNNLKIIANNGKTQVHIDLDAEISNDDLIKLITNFGLE